MSSAFPSPIDRPEQARAPDTTTTPPPLHQLALTLSRLRRFGGGIPRYPPLPPHHSWAWPNGALGEASPNMLRRRRDVQNRHIRRKNIVLEATKPTGGRQTFSRYGFPATPPRLNPPSPKTRTHTTPTPQQLRAPHPPRTAARKWAHMRRQYQQYRIPIRNASVEASADSRANSIGREILRDDGALSPAWLLRRLI